MLTRGRKGRDRTISTAVRVCGKEMVARLQGDTGESRGDTDTQFALGQHALSWMSVQDERQAVGRKW